MVLNSVINTDELVMMAFINISGATGRAERVCCKL